MSLPRLECGTQITARRRRQDARYHWYRQQLGRPANPTQQHRRRHPAPEARRIRHAPAPARDRRTPTPTAHTAPMQHKGRGLRISPFADRLTAAGSHLPGPSSKSWTGRPTERTVMERACDSCRTLYTPRSPLSRYCGSRCAKRAQRTGLARSAQGAAMIAEPPAATQEVQTAVRATLEDAGRLSTPLGQVALALARRLDSPSGDTGSAVAAMARQLQATLSAATADVRPAGDLLHELRARRDRKLGRLEDRS